MPFYNKVILMGHMTRDVELKSIGPSSVVGNFGLAVNRKFKDQQGNNRDETLFVDCAIFGKSAETLENYTKKGDPLFVEGRLKLDQWEDKAGGGKRSKLSVVVEGFQFIRSSGGGDGQKQLGQDDDKAF